MTTLATLASVVRSKNAGPYEITLDVLFEDPQTYARVRESGVLTEARLAEAYRVPAEDIRVCLFFQPALAFKCTILRRGFQGGPGERDTFGAQQHGPLLDIDIP